ncbi:MAG: hypothetical protein D6788_02995 [Planctomycetota bacterium]|nr:MAG: hypothetical protein D6788_02995 [Planctomycetota bacterium]
MGPERSDRFIDRGAVPFHHAARRSGCRLAAQRFAADRLVMDARIDAGEEERSKGLDPLPVPRGQTSAPPIITLITDYGLRDGYTAALKGVILTLAPQVRIVDVTQEIEPFDVQHGAFVLRQVWNWFPPETIHLVVVDPGVGTMRPILLGRYEGRYVIAPDNGLITFVHRSFRTEAMYWVENRELFLADLSSTFHGRDMMAPAAAHLAAGVPPRMFGRPADRVELLPIPWRAEERGGVLEGRVLHVDRFGTLVTNVHRDQLERRKGSVERWRVFVNGDCIGPIRATFADGREGEMLALIGGGGFLEIAVNRGRAADRYPHRSDVRIEVREHRAGSDETSVGGAV